MAKQSKDKWRGRGKQAQGKLKEQAGKLTGDKDAQAEGVDDQIEGKAQEAWGKVLLQIMGWSGNVRDHLSSRKPRP
jgi:uncharacterized protein YjbJ (UPF0337 family)